MKSRKRFFCWVNLVNMARNTVHGLTSSIKEALRVIESPAGKKEFLTAQSTQVLLVVPVTEPSFQTSNFKQIVLRCSLPQRQQISIFSKAADVQ